MHCVQLSATHWINLDQVVEWRDDVSTAQPQLTLVTVAPGHSKMGMRQPYEIHLQGNQRLLMLEALAAATVVQPPHSSPSPRLADPPSSLPSFGTGASPCQ